MENNKSEKTYKQVNDKLNYILQRVKDNPDMSLDHMLDLYDDAIKLGLKSTKIIDKNIESFNLNSNL